MVVVSNGGSVEDIHGDWVPVAFYPVAKGPGQSDDSPMFPVMMADPTCEIAEALNVSCRCGHIQYRHRKVAKQIDNNYLVLYEMQNNALSISDAEPISAQMFTREIPTYLELRFVMKSIEDFKYRNVGIMCTQEFLEAETRYNVLRQRGQFRDRSARSLRVQKFTYDIGQFISDGASCIIGHVTPGQINA
ncbi:hypothetical protein SFRURICE_013997 [Spodoptera frugiperda]|nr:hypothetical protein SFRURICE_013997 [Spodoptera frugiperda]